MPSSRLRQAARLAWTGSKAAAGLGRAAAVLGVRVAKGLAVSARRPSIPRRIYELVPVAERPPPQGFFYLAHIGLELLRRIEARSVFVLPGGVAFFILLGLLPATAAVASIYGLFAEPAELIALSERLSRILPEAPMTLMAGVLERVAAAPASSLGLSAAVALFMTLMSANWATKALIEALNVVFDRREVRNYLEFTGVTLLMTTTAASIVGAYAWLLYRLPGSAHATGLGHWAVTSLETLSIWALLSCMIGAVYRFGPAPRPDQASPPILSGGSMFAACAVLISSWFVTVQFAGTSTFARNFGPLASVAAVGVWAWVTVVVILLGAEIVEIREEEKRRRARSRRWPRLPWLT